jgi:S1-C subfamily serine protease
MNATTSFADAVKRIRPSVIPIAVIERRMSESLGSGFFVSLTCHVITACHVPQALQGHLAIGIAYPNTEATRENFCFVQARVIDQDPVHDLALLQTIDFNPFAGGLLPLIPWLNGPGIQRASLAVSRFDWRAAT